jgi:hypothetical protein
MLRLRNEVRKAFRLANARVLPLAARSRPEGMEGMCVRLLPRLCTQLDGEYDQPWEPACREETRATG